MVASHPDALLENVFASTPDGFIKYGIFTARFYKNGEWKEVLTDTRLPCHTPPTAAGGEDASLSAVAEASNPIPLYGRCRDLGEQWMVRHIIYILVDARMRKMIV